MIIHCIKNPGGILTPCSDQDVEAMAKLKSGKVYSFDFKQKRNGQFHRKFFAMLNIGFEAFEPDKSEYNGLPVQKNFDRFRADLLITAGEYDLVSCVNGEVKAKARSMSFANMKPETFDKLYNNVCQILLTKILSNYTKDDLDQVVDQLIRF